MSGNPGQDWSIEHARRLYNIEHWGGGYFDIGEGGQLLARPRGADSPAAIDVFELARSLQSRGLSLPVLVRFTDVLHDRIERLCAAFGRAMEEDSYEGRYTAVYPVKVNQQHSVVEAIAGDGRTGLECGSKPEFLAVLAQSRPGGLIVCNGYKDREYIELALIGRALGHRVHIVVEKYSELELLIDESRRLGIAPLIGVRLRLASIGEGKWQNTGGEKSKFGLSPAQLLSVVERLRREGLLDRLQMMHFHMGSQIANVRHIQAGLREAGRYYAELRRQGAGVRCINVGGGLGVDYEGTRSRSYFSMNYGLEEYAKHIVHSFRETCREHGLPHPDLVTECGRAMTAHHAMLITNVLHVETAPAAGAPAPAADDPLVLHDLWRAAGAVGERSLVELYHESTHALSEAQGMFNHGVLDLEQRARAEQTYYAVCRAIRPRLRAEIPAHREIMDELNEKLADKYFVNLSIFQSLPDIWAIEQIFPIMPIHRLQRPPAQRGVLADLTCDSDGRIDRYVNGEGVGATLPLHEWRAGEPYLLGIFLVGAYQEILGDMHNLFGDTDSVHVELDPGGGYRISRQLRGDDVAAVLRHVHFDPGELAAALEARLEAARELDPQRRQSFRRILENGLEAYTYLKD